MNGGILISEMVKYEKKVCVTGAGKSILHCAAVSRALSTENTKMLNSSLDFKAQILERAPKLFMISIIHDALLNSPCDMLHVSHQ